MACPFIIHSTSIYPLKTAVRVAKSFGPNGKLDDKKTVIPVFWWLKRRLPGEEQKLHRKQKLVRWSSLTSMWPEQGAAHDYIYVAGTLLWWHTYLYPRSLTTFNKTWAFLRLILHMCIKKIYIYSLTVEDAWIVIVCIPFNVYLQFYNLTLGVAVTLSIL